MENDREWVMRIVEMSVDVMKIPTKKCDRLLVIDKERVLDRAERSRLDTIFEIVPHEGRRRTATPAG
jgi:hypothetical protein